MKQIIGVIELYGKVYVSVDDLVNICREQGGKVKFKTISAQGFIKILIEILEDAKTERINNHHHGSFNGRIR